MLHSGILSYRKLVNYLQDNNFIINPYDPCVANKTVLGKQLTITWHVDNIKVSCKDKLVVDKFIQSIRNEYENIAKLKPSCGKVNNYLVIILD